MRDSFKWHFPAQFLRWAYVIRHNDLHMFGYTISEMIPSPPDDVRGANVDPPESECRSLLCYPIRKERYQIAELSAPLPAQSCRLSAVLFLSASIVSSPHSYTFLMFLSSTYIQSKTFSGKTDLLAQKDPGNG